jgi:hypothetical protein
MTDYTTTTGRVLDLSNMDTILEAFFERVQHVAQDNSVPVSELMALIYGAENPMLDSTIIPGQHMVTRDVFHNPVYHALMDQITIKHIRLGQLDLLKAHAKYTIDVSTAAATLGMTLQGVRAAIESYRMPGIYKNGQWWTTETGIRAFTVSKAGRPKKERVALGAEQPIT